MVRVRGEAGVGWGCKKTPLPIIHDASPRNVALLAPR